MSLNWLPCPESLLIIGAALGAIGALVIVQGNPIVWPQGNERRYQWMILAGAFCIFFGFVLQLGFYLGAIIIPMFASFALVLFAIAWFRTYNKRNGL